MFSTPAVTALFSGCKAFNFASFCLKIDKITRFDWNENIVMPSYILKKIIFEETKIASNKREV